MEEILTLLDGIGQKTRCLPGHDLLNLLAPLVNGLQEIDTGLSLKLGRLQSSSQQLFLEIEKGIKESGIKYVERGPLNCACLSCLETRLSALKQESTEWIGPASKALEDQLQLRISQLDEHPLAKEEAYGAWEKQLQHVKASPVMNACERIWALDELKVSMDKCYERIMTEKEEIMVQIHAKQKMLGFNTAVSLSNSIAELDSMLQSLDDQIRLRSAQIQQSCLTIERLWDLMDVHERFHLNTADMSQANYDRLEAEKARLFEVQKEKFREMLEEQQKQIERLWNDLEMPQSIRDASCMALQSRDAVDTLAAQGELVARLQLMSDARLDIVPKIQKRQALVERMRAFELTAKDPNRLFGPSFRLMEEDRFRKTAYPSLLRIESQLEADLQNFKARFPEDELWWQGRPFADLLAEERENRYINESIFEFPASDKKTEPNVSKPAAATTASSTRQTAKRKIG